MGDALLTQVDSIEFASGDNAITSTEDWTRHSIRTVQ